MVECKVALLHNTYSQLHAEGARMSDLQGVDVLVCAVHGQMDAPGRVAATADEMTQMLGVG